MKRNLPLHVLALSLAFAISGSSGAADRQLLNAPDRTHWPAGLQNVPLEHLSSGALRRLDAGGDLIEAPAAYEKRAAAELQEQPSSDAAGIVDPRVAANVRLGDDPAALPTTHRAQAEPHIARSPVTPAYLLATFQEGRYTDGAAVNCGYSVSRDGGANWTRALIPGLTPSSGGIYPRATDPVAGVGYNGHAYLNTLALGSSTVPAAVLVNRSIDGTNFAPPRIAYQAAPGEFPDKNWMAINTFPGTPSFGRIVVTFTMFPASGPGPHPIMRVYSDDGGQNWSGAALIHAGTNQVQSSQPAFLPDGRLVVLYWNFNNTTGNWSDDFLELVVSNDGGITFGPPQMVTPVQLYDHPQVRDGGFLPSMVADRAGMLHLSYQATHNGQPRIMYSRSANAGSTWTPPVPISDNPPGAGVFNAAVSASPDGQRLAILYYDTRNNPGSNTLVDVYTAMSVDGGNTWQPSLRVSTVSTNAALSPLTAGGYMLGDYHAIAEPSNNGVVTAVPVWIDTRTGNPDPFTARVSVARMWDVKGEFTGDTQTDIIWQNSVTGDRAIWVMNGTAWAGERFLPRIAVEWEIAGTGDFNSDGQSDIVWQNRNTGQRAVWLMNGSAHAGERFLPTIPIQWQIAGTGDFNGDGHTDLVWQNTTTGQRAIWFMNGTTHIGEQFLPTIPVQWQIAGTGDFNRDRQPDLLWENTVTGQRAIWLMNGPVHAGERFLPTVTLDWQIAGSGDFNSDGESDIVWQNTSTGGRAIWLMNGSTRIGEQFLLPAHVEWQIRNR